MRRLLGIRAPIISLVKRPATRILFYVKKEENGVIGDEEKFDEVFPLAEEDKELEAVFKSAEEEGGLPEKVKNAIKGALRILSKWKGDFPPEVNKAVAVLARAVGYGEGSPPPEEKGKKGTELAEKTALGRMEKLVGSLQSSVEKLSAEVTKMGEKEKKEGDEKGGKEDKTVEVNLGEIVEAVKEAVTSIVGEVTGKHGSN